MKYASLFFRIFFCILVLSGWRRAFAQSNGLGFQGYEVAPEKRTSLELCPDTSFIFKQQFSLEFNVFFRFGQPNNFGYLFRIVENGKRNIDLVESYDALHCYFTFKLIIGDKECSLLSKIPAKKIFDTWTHFFFRFDSKKNTVLWGCGSNNVTCNISIHPDAAYKLTFGANKSSGFETTDIPAMAISDIKITDGSVLTYHWPLNEYEGFIAEEEMRAANARVTHPLWLRALRVNWRQVAHLSIRGDVHASFDGDRSLYIISPDMVYRFNLTNDSLKNYPSHNRLFMIKGGQAIYLSGQQKLMDINVDRHQVASFDFTNRRWNKKLDDSLTMSAFYHHNQFYSPKDTSLYVIGGYGYHEFKNTVQQYHIKQDQWSFPKTQGVSFPPRYLSALGVTADGAYLLGGYGSLSGEQSINPKFYCSLYYYDVQHHNFQKLVDLKGLPHDCVFGNHMIIDKKEESFYSLAYNKNSYQTNLQLIKGSLHRSGFIKLGMPIRAFFQDTSTFIDLWYSKPLKQFITIVLNHQKDEKTSVAVYTLNDPPEAIESAQQVNQYPLNRTLTILLITSGSLMIFLHRHRKKGFAAAEADTTVEIVPNERNTKVQPLNKNTIFLFGELEIRGKNGDDLTGDLTPLLKELFLLILVFSLYKERGISSEKLEELLWSDKDAGSAHSNRSVNIGRLRNVLEKVDGCDILKQNGYWKFVIDHDKLIVDYNQYKEIAYERSGIDNENVDRLLTIIERGDFLKGLEFEWLDTVKAHIHYEITDKLIVFAKNLSISEHPQMLIRLADTMFCFDPVNEEAMILKCKALTFLGKHAIAKTVYDHFSREYEQLYGEKFQKRFSVGNTGL